MRKQLLGNIVLISGKGFMTMGAKHHHDCIAIRRSTRVCVLASLLSCCVWSTSANAQDDAADIAAARELAIGGLKLADAGHCANAIDKLSRAEKLHHAPIVLGRLGECLINEGAIVEGTEALRRLLREAVPANPPPALVKARDRAQAALDSAKPKIGSLVVFIREPPEGVTLTIDGQAVSSALFDRSRPTDPGEHQVEVAAPGFLKATRHITMSPGEKQELDIKLVADPQASVAKNAAERSDAQPDSTQRRVNHPRVTAGERHAPSVPTSAETASPNYAPSYVLWSVGTAAAAVGGVFGYLAIKGKKDLDEQCVGNLCPQSSRDDLDGAKRNALVSTILVGSGAAAIAVGTLVYLVSGPSTIEATPATGASIQPVLGLGSVGMSGRF